MKVLYYTWKEGTFESCVDAMQEKGWQVDVLDFKLTNYDNDEQLAYRVNEALDNGYDFIFTFDYIPVLSNVAMERGVIYVSWVYDSPHFTLESKTLTNSCNRVFIFDLELCSRFKSRGVETVFYLPLAFNPKLIKKSLEGKNLSYKYDVTFAGSVPDNSNDNLNRIKNVPEELRGYIDGIEEAQLLIYGYDIIGELFTDDKCNELARYAAINMGPTYNDCVNSIFRDFIREDISAIGRKRTIKTIAEKYELSLFSSKCPEDIPVRYMGYANASKELPAIFRSSKININISARSILSGLPLRVMEVMGAGGFLISNYQSEMLTYFKNDEDIVWYESIDELMDKIDFYLRNDTERERIRRNGYERVSQLFTYDILLNEMIYYIK